MAIPRFIFHTGPTVKISKYHITPAIRNALFVNKKITKINNFSLVQNHQANNQWKKRRKTRTNN